MIAAAVLLTGSVFAASSAFAADEKAPAAAPAAPKQQVAPNPLDKLPEVLATVDGKNITKADLVKMLQLQNISPDLFARIPAEMADGYLYKMIDDMVSQQVFLEQAKKEGFQPSADMAKKQLDEFFKKLPKEQQDAMLQELKAQNMDFEKYKEITAANPQIQNSLAITSYLQKAKVVTDPETVPNADVEKYYRENQEKFKVPESITVSHILALASENDMTTGQKLSEADFKAADEKAKKKFEEVKEKLKKGQKFEDLAMQYSDCGSGKADKGKLPAFAPTGVSTEAPGTTFEPTFTKAAYSIEKIGDIKEVKTPFGYHLIRLDKKTAEHYIKLDEVKNDIKRYLASTSTEKNLISKLDELKKAMKVVIHVKAPEAAAPAPVAK